jgi:hypothetical protein
MWYATLTEKIQNFDLSNDHGHAAMARFKLSSGKSNMREVCLS